MFIVTERFCGYEASYTDSRRFFDPDQYHALAAAAADARMGLVLDRLLESELALAGAGRGAA
jgi:hypothetical protein